ncbi:raptor N-terminal caspase like domain-containing protein [Neohortaea acidophila]|uniref:Raptor N-terminal caspase like domain-containing protein n=1 Tax=Neohortaea acidophila TaxID=245834 RepID=A0A6A6Q0N7_9PEZI|nr:raptor N-terminal caspase like domain-containing protein [Neohortaea acidophila]KAF2485970.1 raptor N-terminal caspase like domain-containing protein [Neohortaea acidophila]
MTRGATAGHLPDLVEGKKSKPPQPVLESFLPEDPPLRRPQSFHAARNGQDAGSDDEDDGLQLRLRRPQQSNGLALRPALLRAQSEVARGNLKQTNGGKDGDSEVQMRHGWHEQLQDEAQATQLNQNFFMYFDDKRHETAGKPALGFDPKNVVSDWRMRDRLKTVCAVLAVCLNVGVDPPDVIKTNPCARLECWVDPIPPDSTNQSSTNNANAQIGKNLQQQYENLSLRTRYKVVLDPTIEELKRYTTNMRRNANHDRVLFHYNGHGVPKPTASGEIWCFNRSYTQYIPVTLYDLQDWVGAPGLWVWDCSAAGGIIDGFLQATEKHMSNQNAASERNASAQQIRWDEVMHLAACRENEVLPTNPDLPADIFTACLTSPIMMAVRFFILQNPLSSPSGVTLDQARNIPGKVSERRTPLGELNWIFTAITDTIAWNCLDKQLFKRLFRQDLMVAALFRNFLLAQRIMRIYHCHPQSHPAIPDTHNHPLWQSWDLAVEMILAQLPKLIDQQKVNETVQEQQSAPAPPQEIAYVHSDFFADQLSAFEVFLASAPANAGAQGYAKPPEQLPIVLQVLLSQVHRLRALILLSKFLDLGPWAVNLALSIGIFPYVLKLLQSQAIELKPPMVFIWARILAVDQTCQQDLLKEKDPGYMYFTNILNQTTGIPAGSVAEHRAMCAFVIAMFCKDYRPGQQAVMDTNPEIIETCLSQLLDMENPLLRQFSCLCLSHLWNDFPLAKNAALAHQAHARVRDRSHDPVPEVRAACLEALTSFVGTGPIEPAVVLEEETLAGVVLSMGMDGSIMVRKELTVFYSTFIKKYENRFIVAAWEQMLEERDKRAGRSAGPAQTQQDDANGSAAEHGSAQTNGSHPAQPSHKRQVSFTQATIDDQGAAKPSRTLSKKTIYRAIWRQVLSMSADPHPEVAKNAGVVVDAVLIMLLESELGPFANDILDELLARQARKTDGLERVPTNDTLSRQRSRDARPETPPSPATPAASRGDGYFSTLSRTASVAAAMKNLVGWGARTPSSESPPSPTRSHKDVSHLSPNYRSRPLAAADAALMAPDALDNITGPPHQPPARVPSAPNYEGRDISKMPTIPLESDFFTWSASYFREPQMRSSEADEPGSLNYNERLWRRNRNDKILASTQPLKEAAGSQRWDVPCGYFGIGAAPMRMVFHQFEDHLVTSDDRDSIAVWDWNEATQLCRFSNANPPGSRVTELRFINEDDQAMLMTGSSDGVIKIFKNYDNPKKIELASSFRALSDLVISDQQNAGLVFDWQQGQGRILVAGDDRVVRVWQAGYELCIADIPARSGSCITSLTSDEVEGNVFVAGFGNGSVRAYDQRLNSRESMIMDWVNRETDHKSWIVGVHLQRGGMRELISAESNGGVRLWDIRMRKAVAGIEGRPREPRNLRSLSVHEHAPVFATGGADHTIRVYNTGLKHLSSFEPYMSYLRLAATPRNAPITATAFHPHRMMLACGAVNDGHVNLFKCEATAEEKQGGVVDEWKA